MKLTVFLILLSFVQLLANNSYAQKTKLSVDLKNTSIEMVLLNIENQSNFKFIYNKEKVDVDSRVSLQLKEKSINETLDALFEGKNVSYTFYGNQVILTNSESESTPSILAECLVEQNRNSEALPYLNQVRNRAVLHDLQEATKDNIAMERRHELAFENHRWLDLIRTGKAIETMNSFGNLMKSIHAYIAPNAFNVTEYRLLYPIPYRELQINKFLKQNSGYGS